VLESKFFQLLGNCTDDKVYIKECWVELHSYYSSSSRHYHNLKHISSMLNELETVRHLINDIDCLQFAIFYHDIIYKSTKSDNELQSARLFKRRISNTSFKEIEKCIKQIEATKNHSRSEDGDTNLLLDLDLAILGSDPDDYLVYASNIRKEYSVFPDFIYRRGRKKIMKEMIENVDLFKTPHFKNLYQDKAIQNMKNEIERL